MKLSNVKDSELLKNIWYKWNAKDKINLVCCEHFCCLDLFRRVEMKIFCAILLLALAALAYGTVENEWAEYKVSL